MTTFLVQKLHKIDAAPLQICNAATNPLENLGFANSPTLSVVHVNKNLAVSSFSSLSHLAAARKSTKSLKLKVCDF